MALDGTYSKYNLRKGGSIGDVPLNRTLNNKKSIYL
jgi:hypothetical protein